MFEKPGFYPVILDTSRQLRLPFSVMQFGWTETMRENEYNFPGGVSSCEFCFRLESEESEVLDWVDGTLLRSALPHCLVKFPGVPYRYRSWPGRRVFFLNYPPQARAAFEAAGFDFSPPNWEFRMTGGIRRILAEFDELGSQVQCRGVPERIDMLALQLIEAVYLQSGQLEPQSDEERRIRNIASALHAGFAEAVDFDRLARREGFSRRKFFRCWQHYYSISPRRYLEHLRMETACRLLLETRDPIAQVAAGSGFQNVSYFIRQFHRLHGVTPLQFRNGARK